MVTMLDCIRRVPALLNDITENRGETFRELWKAYPAGEIDELFLIGSGTSLTAALTARYLAEEASGVRVTVAPPAEFLRSLSVRNPRALYVFVSQTGTSDALLAALEYAAGQGFYTAAVTENRDTPAARKAGAFIDMGCGHEEYGMRTIGYSTAAATLMLLGLSLGRARGALGADREAEYLSSARAAAAHIPEIIEKTLRWMDTCRRQIMRSRFIAFTGSGALYGVALEGAVKIWEAPQYPSAGYELDEGMHGPNYGYTNDDAVIFLNDGAPGSEKGLSLARYMKNEHGNGYVFGLGALDEKDLSFDPAGGAFDVLEFAAAVQVFMYRLAVDGGRDFSVLGIHAKMNGYFNAHRKEG